MKAIGCKTAHVPVSRPHFTLQPFRVAYAVGSKQLRVRRNSSRGQTMRLIVGIALACYILGGPLASGVAKPGFSPPIRREEKPAQFWMWIFSGLLIAAYAVVSACWLGH